MSGRDARNQEREFLSSGPTLLLITLSHWYRLEGEIEYFELSFRSGQMTHTSVVTVSEN